MTSKSLQLLSTYIATSAPYIIVTAGVYLFSPIHFVKKVNMPLFETVFQEKPTIVLEIGSVYAK